MDTVQFPFAFWQQRTKSNAMSGAGIAFVLRHESISFSMLFLSVIKSRKQIIKIILIYLSCFSKGYHVNVHSFIHGDDNQWDTFVGCGSQSYLRRVFSMIRQLLPKLSTVGPIRLRPFLFHFTRPGNGTFTIRETTSKCQQC